MIPSHSPIQEWSSSMEEGQLSVDVFRDKQDLVVRSTVAGAKPEDIDISIHGDLMTIRGKREGQKTASEDDWFYRECYWGAFSRSIVLPYDVKADKAEASMTNGVLEIRIPIRDAGERNIPIRIKE